MDKIHTLKHVGIEFVLSIFEKQVSIVVFKIIDIKIYICRLRGRGTLGTILLMSSL